MTRSEAGKDNDSGYIDLVEGAFDLSSTGMGVQLHALSRLAAGDEIPSWAKTSLAVYDSNYLKQPYIYGWLQPDGPFKMAGPKSLSPRSESHRSLIQATREKYQGLHRKQRRFLLAGDEGLHVADPESPVVGDELLFYLDRAKSNGLIDFGEIDAGSINFDISNLSLILDWSNNGVTINDAFLKRADEILLGDGFREEKLIPAVYKLGSMLAVTDQITYEAAQQGSPIPRNFEPNDEVWSRNWQRMFDEPMPTIEGLYRKAHTVFTQHASSSDPLLRHILELKGLPQLV